MKTLPAGDSNARLASVSIEATPLTYYTPLAYDRPVVFIETPIFTRLVKEALSDEDYGALQQLLADQPDAGDLIRGGGGIRKVRWGLRGRGKSGGIRVIYYWHVRADQIYLLFLFPKGERSDLTPAQVKQLAMQVKELNEGQF